MRFSFLREQLPSISMTLEYGVTIRTLGCMLEGKGHKITDGLESHVVLRTMADTFADDNFDAAKVVGRAPVTLTQKRFLEYGEFEKPLRVHMRYDERPGNTSVDES